MDNLKRACEDGGIKFAQKELEEMIEEADINGDGKVDQSEFIRIMLQTNLFWDIDQSKHVLETDQSRHFEILANQTIYFWVIDQSEYILRYWPTRMYLHWKIER